MYQVLSRPDLSFTVEFRQLEKAWLAAVMAALQSSEVMSGTWPSSSPVTGLDTGKVFPDLAETQEPLTVED